MGLHINMLPSKQGITQCNSNKDFFNAHKASEKIKTTKSNSIEIVFERSHPALTSLDLIKDPEISEAIILPNWSHKLSDIDELVAHTSLVTDNPGEEANHGEGLDHSKKRERKGWREQER
ncbi:hypothetical protein ACLOJK_005116 [Asimina triloba]